MDDFFSLLFFVFLLIFFLFIRVFALSSLYANATIFRM